MTSLKFPVCIPWGGGRRSRRTGCIPDLNSVNDQKIFSLASSLEMELSPNSLFFFLLCVAFFSAASSQTRKDKRQASDSGFCQASVSTRGRCLTLRKCTRLLRSQKVNVMGHLTQGSCQRRRICCPDGTQTSPPQECGEQKNAFTPSILGGRAALDGEWPWMVSLSTGNGHECGGALVTPSHVLTAAHCVIDIAGKVLSASKFKVGLGLLDLRRKNEAGQQTVSVDRVTRHPSFNLTIFRADVAILHLQVPATVGRGVGLICLPDPARTLPLEGKYAALAGWGDTKEGGNGSHVLQTLGSIPIWNRSRCSDAYRRVLEIGEGLFCAGFESGRRDSCQGDSGGPLMWFDPDNQRFSLVGIVSTGVGCGRRGFPGVYTDVLTYLSWIKQQLN